MGFVLSILYFITSYLTPETIFGPLAQYRVVMILAILLLLVSLPKLIGSYIFKTPQSLALIGLSFAAALASLFGRHWAGGAIYAFTAFIPNIFFYFLACLHCDSKRKLQILVLMLLFICLFVAAHGAIDLMHGLPEGGPPIAASTGTIDSDLWNSEHPYLFPMTSNSGNWFYRIRGLGMINDPNDFAQLIVCSVPLMFIFWRPKKMLANLFCVILPVCALLFAMYLTHSRGSLVALTAVAVMAGRRRIGTLPALLLAATLFAGAFALHFTGGRDISADAGADRTSLWGEGLEQLRTHPIFGVGYGQFGDYTENHLTAHNSVVLCATELGLFGLYFWSLFLFPTLRDALAISSPENVRQEEVQVAEDVPFPHPASRVEALDKAEIIRIGRLIFLSLTGFLVSAWFLSRAFAITLFLLGGMAEAVYQMSMSRKMIGPRLRFPRVMLYSAGLAAGLISAVYVMVRFSNVLR